VVVVNLNFIIQTLKKSVWIDSNSDIFVQWWFWIYWLFRFLCHCWCYAAWCLHVHLKTRFLTHRCLHIWSVYGILVDFFCISFSCMVSRHFHLVFLCIWLTISPEFPCVRCGVVLQTYLPLRLSKAFWMSMNLPYIGARNSWHYSNMIMNQLISDIVPWR
jgi:hypothetical protein